MMQQKRRVIPLELSDSLKLWHNPFHLANDNTELFDETETDGTHLIFFFEKLLSL